MPVPLRLTTYGNSLLDDCNGLAGLRRGRMLPIILPRGNLRMVAVVLPHEWSISATPLLPEDPPRGSSLADPNAASALPPLQASSSAMVILGGSLVLMVVVMVLLARVIFPGSFGGGPWSTPPRHPGRHSIWQRCLSALEWRSERKEVIHDPDYLYKITKDDEDLPGDGKD